MWIRSHAMTMARSLVHGIEVLGRARRQPPSIQRTCHPCDPTVPEERLHLYFSAPMEGDVDGDALRRRPAATAPLDLCGDPLAALACG